MSCIKGSGPTREQMTMAEFSNQLFDYLFSRAASPYLQAGQVLGRPTIRLGSTTFTGKTFEEAFDKLFLWIIGRANLDPASVEADAAAAEEHEQEEARRMIDTLVGDGLSPYGQFLELQRGERKNRIFRAVAIWKTNPRLRYLTAEEVLPTLTVDFALEDLNLEEVYEGLREYEQLAASL